MPDSIEENSQILSNSIKKCASKQKFVSCYISEPIVSFIHLDYVDNDRIFIIISLNKNYDDSNFKKNKTTIVDVINVGDVFKILFKGIENATILSKKEVSNLIRHEMVFTLKVIDSYEFQASIDISKVKQK